MTSVRPRGFAFTFYGYATTCMRTEYVEVLPKLFENTAAYIVLFISKVAVNLISVDDPPMADLKNETSPTKSAMKFQVVP